MSIAKHYLFIRTRHHYHEIRESVSFGNPAAMETLARLDSSRASLLGDSPWALMASLQRYAAIGEREAMILAFNEVTAFVALCIAVSIMFMPLVRSIKLCRDYN